jgi:hypothetical protein
MPPATCTIAELAALWRYESYVARCVRPPHLQDFPEFSVRLRGAFGRALHDLPPRVTGRGKVLPAGWTALFEPLALQTAGPGAGDEVPRPLCIRAWIADNIVYCEVRVFGWGMFWHQEAGAALMRCLERGIAFSDRGRSRAALELIDLTRMRMDGIDVPAARSGALLHFRAPFASRLRGAVNDNPRSIVPAIIRRVQAMARWQGFALPSAAALLRETRALKVTAQDWRTYGWTRHSQRQRDNDIPAEGMLGSVMLEGDLERLAPWIALAASCNIGSHASMGMGWFDVAVW